MGNPLFPAQRMLSLAAPWFFQHASCADAVLRAVLLHPQVHFPASSGCPSLTIWPKRFSNAARGALHDCFFLLLLPTGKACVKLPTMWLLSVYLHECAACGRCHPQWPNPREDIRVVCCVLVGCGEVHVDREMFC